MKAVVLLEGIHKPKEPKTPGARFCWDPISSSVTLLKAETEDEPNVIVDTGCRSMEKELLEKLKANSLTADDIDYVINTHDHFDHCGNNHLFRKARIILNTLQFNTDGSLEVFERISQMSMHPNIEIVDTPGHKERHTSVIARLEKTYVVSGDLFFPNKDGKMFKVLFYEDQIKIQSAEKIVDGADVIIPGHGKVIESTGMKKLKEEIMEEKEKWQRHTQKQ